MPERFRIGATRAQRLELQNDVYSDRGHRALALRYRIAGKQLLLKNSISNPMTGGRAHESPGGK